MFLIGDRLFPYLVADTMALGSVLRTSLTGISAATFALRVTSNNVANSLTAGFNAGRPIFATQPSTTHSIGGAPSAASGGSNPVQIGAGVKVIGVTELSEPDVAQSIVETLLASQSFRANAFVFGTASHLLDELTNLRRSGGG